jgi:hypothetical protein
LNVSFIVDYETWRDNYNKDEDIYTLYPPLGFFDDESVNISILLSDSFDFNYHWYEVYHHELMHYLCWIIDGDETTTKFDDLCRHTQKMGYYLFREYLPLEKLHLKKMKYSRNVAIANTLVYGGGVLAQYVYENLVDAYGHDKVKWNVIDDCENLVFRHCHICLPSHHNFLDKTLLLLEKYDIDCVFIHSNIERSLFDEIRKNMDLKKKALSYCPPKDVGKLKHSAQVFFFRESHCGFARQNGPIRREPRHYLEKAGFQIEVASPWCQRPGDFFCINACIDLEEEVSFSE